MKKKIKMGTLFNTAAMLIPVGILVYFCVSENGLTDLLKEAEKFSIFWLVASVLCHFSNVFIDACIIFTFTKNYEKSYTFLKAVKTCFVGQFFGAITPANSGAGPAQVVSMSAQGVKSGVATSVFVQKFLAYQTVITVYSALAIAFNLDLFQGSFSGAMEGLAAFGFLSHAVVVGAIFVFSFNPKLTSKIMNLIFKALEKIKIIKNVPEKIQKTRLQIENFTTSNKEFYKKPKLVAVIYFLTFLQLSFIFLVPYGIYRTFNFRGASAMDMVTAQSIVTMISSFMPLPGGAGAAEGGFYVFFALFFTTSAIKSAVLVWRIITYFLNIIVAAPFSKIRGKTPS